MHKDYSQFDIEDFAFDESFQQWVLEEKAPCAQFWNNYIETHPHQINTILAARQLVVELHDHPSEEDSYEEVMHHSWQQIHARINASPSGKPFFKKYHFIWIAAACFVVGVSAVLLWYHEAESFLQAPSNAAHFTTIYSEDVLVEKINTTSSTITFRLADSSSVQLSPGSKLVYPKAFNMSERKVQLEGEAFFEVTKNAHKPFLIYANETVTKVLGTSFRIQAPKEKSDVVVSVKTGKVSVFKREELEQKTTPRGVILTANVQVEFSAKEQQFHKTLVEEPDVLPEMIHTRFDFDDTPLQEVFDVLQEAYGIEIIYDAELVRQRTLRVNFDDESLYEKLTIVCNTMGLRYQIIDAKIVIERNT